MFDNDSTVYLAQQARIAAYASVACLTAFILDWILSAEEEVDMYQRGRFNKPIITYSLARLSTVALLVCSAVENTAPFLYTDNLQIIVYVLWWTSGALTSFLFFFRVRAVFSRSPKAKLTFSVLWVLTTLIPTPWLWNLNPFRCTGVEHSNKICDERTWYSMAFFLVIIIHDTLVFVYVSHELSNNSVTGRCNIRTLTIGKGLHDVSKLLLRTGQLYYGATVSLLIIAIIALLKELPFYIIFGTMHQAISVLPCPKFFSSTKLFGTPAAALIITYVTTFIVTLAPPPGDAFNFLVDLHSYPKAVFSLATVAAVYILRRRNQVEGRPQAPYRAWHLALVIAILQNVFVLAMPWWPPKEGRDGGDVSFWYATYCVVGIGILVLCVVYWYIWTHILPNWRGYHLEERTFVLDDGAVTKTLVKIWQGKDDLKQEVEGGDSHDKKQSQEDGDK
ncbi:hypothetical protein FIBSPDRAFT_1040856 [Athelia psychrophila]|uniref:DUF6533 domain-containing protein n=1 Tax=Athelia psychrophila TaxID=1759441 RepID=A0A166PPL6_9AGAM|nr:hypothetical protein FIBSPDRAFT_1040856 [Fibularhizoctonia sp. CBS 109695]